MKSRPISAPKNWRDLTFHPLACLVEFGAGIDLEQMREHMRVHGYDETEFIMMFEGMLLDGRHRFTICKELDITPAFREFQGPNAFAYVAKKAFRQHLDTSQRAMLAAILAKQAVGRPKELGGNPPNFPTTEQAAKALNVSSDTVKAAKTILQHGTPEQQASVRNGQQTVSHVAEQIKETRPVPLRAKKNRKQKPPKAGAEAYKLRDFETMLGAVVRQIDVLGNAYDAKETPEAEGLRRKLAEFNTEFRAWHKALTKPTR